MQGRTTSTATCGQVLQAHAVRASAQQELMRATKGAATLEGPSGRLLSCGGMSGRCPFSETAMTICAAGCASAWLRAGSPVEAHHSAGRASQNATSAPPSRGRRSAQQTGTGRWPVRGGRGSRRAWNGPSSSHGRCQVSSSHRMTPNCSTAPMKQSKAPAARVAC